MVLSEGKAGFFLNGDSKRLSSIVETIVKVKRAQRKRMLCVRQGACFLTQNYLN